MKIVKIIYELDTTDTNYQDSTCYEITNNGEYKLTGGNP